MKVYVEQKQSAKQIAVRVGCSENKVNYWLRKHAIPKRSLSDAQYVIANPSGDPYRFIKPRNESEWLLYGLGLGLWWGEGNKVSKTAIRLGNTGPDLLRVFLDFLKTIFKIDETRLRFGLQIFTDTSPDLARSYWSKRLGVSPEKFQKVVVSESVAKGTYRHKSEYGVLTIYFSNTKIRDSIYRAIEELRTTSYANVAQSVERIHGGSHRPLPAGVVMHQMNPE